MALAAGLTALFFAPREPDRLGLKGGPVLGFYVQHGDQVRRGTDGETVAAHDAIRFSYTAAEPVHLGIFSIDGAGAVSRYYPAGDRTRAEPAGADMLLPISTRLDGVLGPERIFALFCAAPIDLRGIEVELRHAGRPPAVDGCREARLEWKKAP